MDQYELISKNPEHTYKIAKTIGRRLQEGDIILLEGDLGAGKTTFTKGLAVGLDIKKNVNSPTFTIVKEYNGRLPLYHMDVYRVEDAYEDLGLDEYFYGDGVSVVEWAHLIEGQLPSDYLQIEIYRQNDEERRLLFIARGKRYEALIKELQNEHFSD